MSTAVTVDCETCDREAARVDAGALTDLRLPPELLAAVPAPRRDAVRLLVGRRGTGEVTRHGFRELPRLLRAGDVLVVNTSRTLPSALDGRLTDATETAWRAADGHGTHQHGTHERPTDAGRTGRRGADGRPADAGPTGRRNTGGQPTEADPTDRHDAHGLPTDPDPTDRRNTGGQPTEADPTDRHDAHGLPTDPDPTDRRNTGGLPTEAGPMDWHGAAPGAGAPSRGGSAAGFGGASSGEPVVVHFSTRRDDGRWVVEVRSPDGRGSTVRRTGGRAGSTVALAGGGRLVLERRLDPAADRLWVAAVDLPDVPRHLHRHGRPIRYSYTERDQPLSAYQTVFGTPSADGRASAEMPSAARPFTASLVTELVSRGVQVAPIVLHTGVASAEAHEPPYAEPYEVPASTAWQVNAARAAGGRVVAVGTTAVRALESAADGRGVVRAAHGWTELVVTPERGVRAVDGLLTGLHEPEASHLLMLRALSGDDLLARVYAEALRARFRWHEFGDVNLLLP
jgi:S-adenosylmethionine:tRNA ribosyltransferase-isomerase